MAASTGSINPTHQTLDTIENLEHEDIIDDSEERELVNDSGSSKILDASEAPQDPFNLVYLLFYLYGITSLLPWNFLMTANDYWMYKFRKVVPDNVTAFSYTEGKTPFQAEFTSYLNVATAVPNLVFLILNTLYGQKIAIKTRLLGSMTIITASFILTTAMVQVNTDSSQSGFFIFTMVTVVIMTGASAVFIGSLFGVCSKFPDKYMAAVISGQSLGGIVAAIAQIISLTFKISPQHSAMIYFLMADILVITSFVSYVGLHRLDFFNYYMLKGASSLSSNRHREVSMITVCKKIWVYGFTIFAVFAISMSVYPAVTVLVQSHPVNKGTDWNNIYFVPVVNYLFFNLGDYSGRLSAAFLMRPTNQWIIAGASILRIIGVPMLMLCNALPRKHLPVLFPSDYEYLLIMIVFAYSNGYLTNISMINASRLVEPYEREKTSSAMATLLSVGLTVGAAFSLLFVRLI